MTTFTGPTVQEPTMTIERSMDHSVFSYLMSQKKVPVMEARQAAIDKIAPSGRGLQRNPWMDGELGWNATVCLAISLRQIVKDDIEEKLGLTLDSGGFIENVYLDFLGSIDFHTVAKAIYQGFTAESIPTGKHILVRSLAPKDSSCGNDASSSSASFDAATSEKH